MENNKANIYCPECGRKVAEYDGKSRIPIKVKCRNCEKLVIYDIENLEVRTEKVPVRTTGSGMRLY